MKTRLPFKDKVVVTCEICGKTKTVYNNPKQSFKYCSRECYQKARGAIEGGKVEITCKRCGTTKVVPHKEVMRGQHRYCSKRCAALDLNQIPPQEHNHACEYNGFKFRSKGEARYAEWCDVVGIKWLYEPQVFNLSNCSYIPDFYLPKLNKWIEIKCDINDKKYKTDEFAINNSLLVLFRKDINKIRRGLDHEWKN
jgi:endogenous inhibitor of DNA gyrase (YacG/DUF329 family)